MTFCLNFWGSIFNFRGSQVNCTTEAKTCHNSYEGKPVIMCVCVCVCKKFTRILSVYVCVHGCGGMYVCVRDRDHGNSVCERQRSERLRGTVCVHVCET